MNDYINFLPETVIEVDIQGKLIFANKAAFDKFGYTQEDFEKGLHIFEFIPHEEWDRAKCNLEVVLKGGDLGVSEYTVKRKDDSVLSVIIHANRILDDEGNPRSAILIILDITEHKSMEEELRESEKKYRALFESRIDGLAVIDAGTLKVLMCNELAAKVYGFNSAEEAIGVNAIDFIHPEDRDRTLRHILVHMFEEDSQQVNGFRTITKDGREKWIEAVGVVIEYQGKTAGLASFRDITERKQIEEALRKSEEKLRFMFESMGDGTVVTNLAGNIIDENEACIRIFGYDNKGDFIGINGLEFISEKDRGRARESLMRALQQNKSETMEFTLTGKDGREFQSEITTALLRDQTASPSGFICVIRDITERKYMESALRESEEKLRLIFESIEDGIVVIDTEGKILDLNESILHQAGYQNKSQLIGINAYEFVSPTDRSLVNEDMQRRLEGNPKARMEYAVRTKDGNYFETELTAATLRDENGDPTGYIGVLRDVTERKRAEEKLKESEKKYKELVESERDVIFAIDAAGIITSVNSAVNAWGYGVNEIIGKNYSVFIPADSLDRLLKELPISLLSKGDVVAETLGLDREGKWRPIEFSATVINRDGKFAGVRGIVRDITERKQAEEKLKQRNRELATLNKIAEAVSHPLGLNRVLRTALDSVLETMKFTSGSIWLINKDTMDWRLITSRGAKEIPVDAGEMKRAVDSGEVTFSVYFPESETSLTEELSSAKPEEAKSIIGVPLKAKGEILGVLGVVSKNQVFTANDIRLMDTIGDQIAVAIENAQLLEKLNELSITDELTGLYNRRHFYEVIENETNRTRRYGRCISLAMIDLDGFKKYNDKFGHASGDTILADFARALKEALRRTDTAFRYGGDEFIVILPSTNAGKAKEVIERVRRNWLKQLNVQSPDAGNLLGFSAGIAQFPDNAETVDGLVFLTDTALYYAKRGGKRRVMLISDLGASSLDALSSTALDQVYALAATVDTRDPYTYGHSKRVATIAESLGKDLGMYGDELSELVAAAFLHDIGKVGVADTILTKPGKPGRDEWAAIKKHCAEGAKIVRHVKELAPLAPYILHHHEWWDGSGYPEGLRGEDIPLSARIISVADAFDTMTAKRPYREAISEKYALQELERCSGTQFDPKLIEALCRICNNGDRGD